MRLKDLQALCEDLSATCLDVVELQVQRAQSWAVLLFNKDTTIKKNTDITNIFYLLKSTCQVKHWTTPDSLRSSIPVRAQRCVRPLHLLGYYNSHQDLLIFLKMLNVKMWMRCSPKPACSPVTHLLPFTHLEMTNASLSSTRWRHLSGLFPARFKVTFLPNTTITTTKLSRFHEWAILLPLWK